MPSARFFTPFAGFCALIAVALLDQWSKTTVIDAAFAGGIPRDITPFFNLVLVHNSGISFGLFARMQDWMPMVLTGLTSLVALALFIWLLRVTDRFMAFALGFIIGGAIGNIIDRVRLGAVTDFLDFHWRAYHWPAFNLADSAIFIGVVILVLISIVRPSSKEKD